MGEKFQMKHFQKACRNKKGSDEASFFKYKIGVSLLPYRIAGEAAAQFLEDLAVYLAEHDSAVDLTVAERGQLLQGTATTLVVLGEDREGHEDLVGMQTGILAAKILDLGFLDRLYHALRDEFHLVVDAGQMFGGIEQQGGTATEQRRRLGGDDGAVGEFHGGSGVAAEFLLSLGGHGDTTVGRGDLGLIEEQQNLVDLALAVYAVGQFVGGRVVAPDDLVARGLTAHLIVADAEAHHIDAHVGGRLVGILAVDALEQGVEHGEYLDVAVVVDGNLVVGLQVEGIDHVDIVEVGRGCLVGDVDRMLEGQVPDGEGLKLGIAGTRAPLVLVVELGEADSHLAAAGTGGGDDDQGARGLHIVVFAKALVAGDEFDVVGIAVDEIMYIGLDAQPLQAVTEGIGGMLTVVVGDDHRADHEAPALELVAQTEHILVVGDAQVGTHLVLLDVLGTDDDDDLDAVSQLAEHTQFAVGLEAGQDAGGMMVVEEFAAEFEIEFAVELGYTFLDVF